MAFALEVAIVDGGDHTIKVVHTFFGVSEDECRNYYREHLASCSYFRAAERAGRVLEDLQEIDGDELPTPESWDEEEEEEENYRG